MVHGSWLSLVRVDTALWLPNLPCRRFQLGLLEGNLVWVTPVMQRSVQAEVPVMATLFVYGITTTQCSIHKFYGKT